MRPRPTVLFVCVHNAGRSQMAAALLEHHAAGSVTVLSAGSAPAATVNPAVVEVMRELGIDLATATPKKLSDAAVEVSDVVVSRRCGDACPVIPGKRYVTWDLGDPAGQAPDVVRRIRDDIEGRVRALLSELQSL
jgi:arsenate reductase